MTNIPYNSIATFLIFLIAKSIPSTGSERSVTLNDPELDEGEPKDVVLNESRSKQSPTTIAIAPLRTLRGLS